MDGEELGGGVVGRAPCPEAEGDEGTEELPPPPDVASCNVEGGAWSGTPMPKASMNPQIDDEKITFTVIYSNTLG